MYRVMRWTLVATFVGNLTIANAELLQLLDRGCTPDETYVHTSNVSYQTRNASGSVRVSGFSANPAGADNKNWTWSTAVQQLKSEKAIYQPIWVDAAGIDLASPDLGFDLCYIMIVGQDRATQKRGQGDKGDCLTFLGADCVRDWQKNLKSQALNFRTNDTRQSPCSMADRPGSCKSSHGSLPVSGRIPTPKRNCSLGGGDPDYDVVALNSGRQTDKEIVSEAEVFDTYDEFITAIRPFLVLAWSTENKKNTTKHWSDTRVMCLSTPDVVEGSRRPPGVPSAGIKVCLASYGVLSSLVTLIWLLF